MLRLAPLCVVLFAACAGPDAHLLTATSSALHANTPEATRPPVARTLAPDDPLAASNCSAAGLSDDACVEVKPQAAPAHHHHHDAAPEAGLVEDPVCHMKLNPAKAKATVEHHGQVVHFCSLSCKKAFLAEHPEAK